MVEKRPKRVNIGPGLIGCPEMTPNANVALWLLWCGDKQVMAQIFALITCILNDNMHILCLYIVLLPPNGHKKSMCADCFFPQICQQFHKMC